jgi:hypothetical protein
MEGIPSGRSILTPDSRYYTHRWTTLFGAGQRFPPTPSKQRLSTGDSRSLFSILLTLAITWLQDRLLLDADLGTGRVDDDVGWPSSQTFKWQFDFCCLDMLLTRWRSSVSAPRLVCVFLACFPNLKQSEYHGNYSCQLKRPRIGESVNLARNV